MTPFGQNVLLWRVHQGLTQEGLSQRAGITRPNLSAIERGKREVSLTTLRSLALALDVSPGILVDGIPPTSAQTQVFSRQALERIADAVWKGIRPKSSQEEKVAGLLKPLLRSGKNLSRGKRSSERAWLQLKSSYPAQVIQTLIERIRDREQLHGSKTN